jgi:hypothetical protein
MEIFVLMWVTKNIFGFIVFVVAVVWKNKLENSYIRLCDSVNKINELTGNNWRMGYCTGCKNKCVGNLIRIIEDADEEGMAYGPKELFCTFCQQSRDR